MSRIERDSIALDDAERGRLYAIWSRSGKRLIVTMHRNADYMQVELRPDQVESFAQVPQRDTAVGTIAALNPNWRTGRRPGSTSAPSPFRNRCRPFTARSTRRGTLRSTPFYTRPALYPTTATASISTSMRASIRPLTSTIVIAGRTSPNTSPWARPTSSAREMSVT